MASSARIDELKKKFDDNPRRYFAPLANEYRKAGDVAEAIRLCRTHLPQQPGHMSGHIVFGQALFEAQELDEARTVFEAALALDPENLIALRHLGDIAKGNGDVAVARGWYQRVLDADPRNQEIAAQMESLEALPDAPEAGAVPATAAADEGGMSGWGDINPEHVSAASPADEPPAQPSKAPHEADLESTTLVMDPPRARPWSPLTLDDAPDHASADAADDEAPAYAGAAADQQEEQFPEFDHTSEIDTSSLAFDELPEAAEPEPAAPSISDAEALFADSPFSGSMNAEPMEVIDRPVNDLGLEVMEFVPPVRTPRAEPEAQPFLGQMLNEDAPPAETPEAFVTETMAELYLQQGFQQEALSVYRQLLVRSPDDESLKDRVYQLEHGSRSSISLAAISDTVIDAARKRQEAPSGRSIRSFFGALAGRRAPRRAGGTPSGGQSVVPGDPAFEVDDHRPSAATPWGVPDSTPDTAGGAAGYASPPAEPGIESGSVDELFGSAGVPSSDDGAAATLAGVFSTGTPDASGDLPGRPTRAASTELSLDHVFRDMPRKVEPRRTTGGFSFDQFFSDSAGGTGGAPADDAGQGGGGATGGATPSSSAPGNDIEQFNAWLDGLKKK